MDMPTIKIISGYRFFFYSNDHDPVHVHVEKDNKTAKYCLVPLELKKSKGFNATELKRIGLLVEENKALFKQKWYEYFND